MKCSIIVLTYNQVEDTKKCLESILRFTEFPYELIVVDNKSEDDTRFYLEELKRDLKNKDIKLVFNDQNYGFSRGCNIGMSKATGDYICLLNNDTIVNANWLKNMIQELQGDSKALIGPKSDGMHPPMYIESAEMMDGIVREVDTLYGFCFVFSKELLKLIGGLDERYKVGTFEDIDFVERIKRLNGKVLTSGKSYIYHKHHASWSSEFNHKMIMLRNMKRFEEKWGFGSKFDQGFKERPYFSCDKSIVLIAKNADQVNEEFDELRRTYANDSVEWLLVDKTDDNKLHDLFYEIFKGDRLTHIRTAYPDELHDNDLMAIGMNNAFGKKIDYKII